MITASLTTITLSL